MIIRIHENERVFHDKKYRQISGEVKDLEEEIARLERDLILLRADLKLKKDTLIHVGNARNDQRTQLEGWLQKLKAAEEELP